MHYRVNPLSAYGANGDSNVCRPRQGENHDKQVLLCKVAECVACFVFHSTAQLPAWRQTGAVANSSKWYRSPPPCLGGDDSAVYTKRRNLQQLQQLEHQVSASFLVWFRASCKRISPCTGTDNLLILRGEVGPPCPSLFFSSAAFDLPSTAPEQKQKRHSAVSTSVPHMALSTDPGESTICAPPTRQQQAPTTTTARSCNEHQQRTADSATSTAVECRVGGLRGNTQGKKGPCWLLFDDLDRWPLVGVLGRTVTQARKHGSTQTTPTNVVLAAGGRIRVRKAAAERHAGGKKKYTGAAATMPGLVFRQRRLLLGG